MDHKQRKKEEQTEHPFRDPHFHTLKKVAVGARVIVTSNLDVPQGNIAGKAGTVTSVSSSCIQVRMDDTQQTQAVGKSKQRAWYDDKGKRQVASTFPLALGSANTVYKQQGDRLTTQEALKLMSRRGVAS